jgi:hypothetical protein
VRRAAALAALALTGCFTPTWRSLAPGEGVARESVVLVGRFAVIPPIAQMNAGGAGNVIIPGSMNGNAAAYFTRDLSVPFSHEPTSEPFAGAWTAWVPFDGWFFIEVPRREEVYFRGVAYVTNAGSSRIEAAARVPIRPGDRVIYVGELSAIRSGDRRLAVRSRLADARAAAEELGFGALAAERWQVRLAEPTGSLR